MRLLAFAPSLALVELMNRIVRFFVLVVMGATARVAIGSADVALYRQTSERLLALIDSAQADGDPSLVRTKEVLALVESVSSNSAVLRSGASGESEFEMLTEICGLANRMSMSLLLFGAKAHINPVATQEQMQAELLSLMNRNTIVFEDHLKDLQPFLLRCLARQLSALSQFVAKLRSDEITDVRKQGLARMRSGMTQLLLGVVAAANDSRYSEEYRLSLLEALAETSPVFAQSMEPAVRQQLYALTSAAASQAQRPYKRPLDQMERALGADSCNALCALR